MRPWTFDAKVFTAPESSNLKVAHVRSIKTDHLIHNLHRLLRLPRLLRLLHLISNFDQLPCFYGHCSLPSTSTDTIASPLFLPLLYTALARFVMAPPVAVIVCITRPIHSTTAQLTDERTAYCSPRAVLVFCAVSAFIARFGCAAAELADGETTIGAP
jgi:hypothetical protein